MLSIVELKKRIFSLKGILYLVTRFGSENARKLALDGYYESGKWDYFESTHSEEVIASLEKYLNKGALLDMGCGPGIVSSLLDPDSYSYYLGVDASEEAINRANARATENKRFICRDFQGVDFGQEVFSVILFEESLYYLSSGHVDYCQKLKKHLLPGGVFIVTVADPKRYASLLSSIRGAFNILEDRPLGNSRRCLLVFN